MASGASRNDPCPCGSGRKLKKCCGASGPAARSPDRLADEIATFALRVTDAADLQAAWEEHGETGSVRPGARRFGIFMDWLIAGRRRGGRTLLERFEAERGATLSEDEHRTLEVHKATRIGVYEVVAARPGTGLRLKDLFSGEEAEIGDVSASRQAVVHDVIAARVRWTDAPPTLWGEAIVFGPLEKAEFKFDLETAYAQAKVQEPELSWHGFLNSAPPLIRRLQMEYRSRRTVSTDVGPTAALRTAADATRLLAAAALERQARWPDTPVPALGGRTPREAARAPEERGFLLDLLKEYERNQSRVPIAAGVAGLVNVPAIVWMRRALGLPVTEELSMAAERLKKAAGTQDD